MALEGIRLGAPSLLASRSETLTANPAESDHAVLSAWMAHVQRYEIGITRKTFAHRVIPAHLNGSEIAGIASETSARHWCRLLAAWIQEGPLLSLNISRKHLIELRDIMLHYLGFLELHRGPKEPGEKARASLMEIEKEITKGPLYAPLGYAPGLMNGGHAIPLKLKLVKSVIEALFLNLGEGVELHPYVDESLATPKYHFQFFPIHIPTTELFSKTGVETFTRLMRVLNEECPTHLPGYSAKDVVGPVIALGKLQSSFSTPIADRSRKPQLGDICGDKAVEMVLTDALIDRGYKKETIQRFFCIEKIEDILMHYQAHLTTMDDWVALKNGIQEFAIRGLKVSSGVLSEKEVSDIHCALRVLSYDTQKEIQKLKKVKIFPIAPLEMDPASLPIGFDRSRWHTEDVTVPFSEPTKIENSDTLDIPSITPFSPEKTSETLFRWVQFVSQLAFKQESARVQMWVYRALCSLEIPDPDRKDFWDAVPLVQIPPILDSLQQLVARGVRQTHTVVFRNILILSIGYAIADKLTRRLLGEPFKGFASPFYPSRYTLYCRFNGYDAQPTGYLQAKEPFFEFYMIPDARANRCWVKIRHYFETLQARSSHTLFALEDEDVFISHEVKNMSRLRNHGVSWNASQQHLQFLESFISQVDPALSKEEKFKELWMNDRDRYIPKEFEILYFFAYYSWHSFSSTFEWRSGRVFRHYDPIKGIIGIGSTFSAPMNPFIPQVQMALGYPVSPLFNRSTDKPPQKLTENETQCLVSGFTENVKMTRMWKRILAHPTLQISSITQWMRSHIPFLLQEEKSLMLGLFQPGLLAKKIGEEPSFLDQLRTVIQEGIAYYTRGSHNHTALQFLTSLGLYLETYASSPEFALLNHYESILCHPDQNRDMASRQLLFLYEMGLPQGDDSLRELIKAFIWGKIHSPPAEIQIPSWLDHLFPMDLYEERIRKCFDDSGWLEKTCSEVLLMVFTELEMPQEAAQGRYPVLQKGCYQIDVRSGSITKADQALMVLKEEERKLLNVSPTTQWVWGKDGVFAALDNLVMIMKHPTHVERSEPYILFRRFPTLEREIGLWYSKIHLQAENRNYSLLLESSAFDFWKSTSFVGDCVICKAGTSTPLYVVTPHTNVGDLVTSFCIRKIRPDGSLGPYLMNIWDHAIGYFLWFKRLGNPQEVCFWVDRAKHEVVEIDLLACGLSFTKEEQGFRCEQYPEWFLDEDQTLEELGHFGGALVLTNGTQQGVILPMRKLTSPTTDFSSSAVYESDFLSSELGKIQFFHVDSVRGVLCNPHPGANLYLAYLFALQRDYSKALFYLQRASSFASLENECPWAWVLFPKLKTRSPEALAFYLHVALHMIHNNEQLHLQGYKRRTHPPKAERVTFYTQVASWYGDFLRLQSSHAVSRIPHDMRIAHEDELILIRFLKRFFLQTPQLKELWLRQFDDRLDLLQSGKITKHIPAGTYALPMIRPLVFWDLDYLLRDAPPQYKRPEKAPESKVRFTLPTIQKHFITLYENARSGTGWMDVFYLLRSAPHRSPAAVYGQLLLYVQKNRNQFNELHLGDDPELNRQVFEKVVELARAGFKEIEETAAVAHSLLRNPQIPFSYQKTTRLTLPRPPQLALLEWNIPQEDVVRLKKLPTSIYRIFRNSGLEYNLESILPSTMPFVFERISSQKASPTQWALVSQLNKGHALLRDHTHGKAIYYLAPGLTLEACQNQADDLLSSLQDELTSLKERAEVLANSYPPAAFRLGMRKIGSDLPHMTIDGILSEAYQKKDPMIIRRANPSLQPSQITLLITQTIEYHIKRVLVHQLQRGIEGLEKGSVQAFGAALAVHGEFDPTVTPALYLYQSRTGKTSRPTQASFMSWNQKTRSAPRRLFSAPAGDGKTSYFIPIEMEQLIAEGFLPGSVSSVALMNADRTGLQHSVRDIFNRNLDILELALNTETVPADFERMYLQLERSVGKQGYKFTPEFYYALFLKHRLALEMEDKESLQWLNKIFDLFEEKVALLIDEIRINGGPFTQAKIGIGKLQSLPPIDRKVIVEIFKALLRTDLKIEDGRSVCEVVGLQNNLQATMSQQERASVKKALLAALVALPGSQADPARAADLIEIFFRVFYPTAMQMVRGMQYVSTLSSGKDHFVPARCGQATLNEFDEVYVTLFTTIQGLLQKGLDFRQGFQLLLFLREDQSREASSASVAESETLLRKWMGDPHLRLQEFHDVSELLKRASKNSETIFWYLERILHTIQYSPEHLVVTPVHLLNSARKVTLFSADPGAAEMYGLQETDPHVRKDTTFMAHALHQFLKPENREIVVFPHLKRPRDLFTTLLQKDPAIFARLRMITDPGGMLRNFTADEIVEDFLEFFNENPHHAMDGVILHEESSTQASETKLQIMLKGWDQPIELQGLDIPKAMAAVGLNWHKLHLLIVIDPSHRAGANILIPKHPTGGRYAVLALAGEDLASSNSVQGKTRGRGTLEGEQDIITGIGEKLASSLGPSLSPETIAEWELMNEASLIDKEILLAAYQWIDYYVAQEAEQELKKARQSPEKQIQIWKKYRAGFVIPAQVDPIQRFKEPETYDLVKNVLTKYAKARFSLFYTKSWDKATDLHTNITSVIAWVQKRMLTIPTRPSFDSTRQTTLHTHQHVEIKTETVTTSIGLTAATPLAFPPECTIDRKDFVSRMISHSRQAQEVFKSQYLTPRLWFTHNALNTARLGERPLRETYLKPAQYVLITLENQEWSAFALSDEEADIIQTQLLTRKSPHRQIALLAADGKIAQNGPTPFTQEQLQALFVQDALMDVGLARCTLLYPRRFMDRIQYWNDFWPMWQLMKQWQPLPDHVHSKEIEKLVPAHLPKDCLPPPQPSKLAWLYDMFFS